MSDVETYTGPALKSKDLARVVWGLVGDHARGLGIHRVRQWYHVARLVKVDGKWYETYWLLGDAMRGKNAVMVRKAATDAGYNIEAGLFYPVRGENGSVVAWTEEKD
jgi:hypothetical protein